MPPGCPKKKLQNISGLRGQAQASCTFSSGQPSVEEIPSQHNDSEDASDNVTLIYNGLKVDFELEYRSDSDEESGDDEESELEVFGDEEFGQRLAVMIEKEEEGDPDWIPERLQKKRERQALERKCEC
jgi:hypothetical protein